MRALRLCVLALSFLTVLSNTVSAQVLYGTLLGNVTDPSQGAVAKAAVTISNNATGHSRSVLTDDRGSYEFNNVQAGTYSVKITAPGFTTFEASGIPVTVN